MLEKLEQKINYLKENFPIGQVVIDKKSKCRYKVHDYNYSENGGRLLIRVEQLDEFPCHDSIAFDTFIEKFELLANNYIRKDEFLVTYDHIQLLSSSYVYWDDCEFGAPGIDPKRPFGNSDVEKDYEDITGKTFDYRVYKQLETCLQILLDNLSIHAGLYRYDEEDDRWYEV